MDKLQKLSESEINFTVSSFYDGGFDFVLGDDMNGTKETGSAQTFDELRNNLWESAKKHYPNAQCFKGD